MHNKLYIFVSLFLPGNSCHPIRAMHTKIAAAAAGANEISHVRRLHPRMTRQEMRKKARKILEETSFHALTFWSFLRRINVFSRIAARSPWAGCRAPRTRRRPAAKSAWPWSSLEGGRPRRNAPEFEFEFRLILLYLFSWNIVVCPYQRDRHCDVDRPHPGHVNRSVAEGDDVDQDLASVPVQWKEKLISK